MTHEIEQGTWERIEKAQWPEDITTGGLGNCTGIIAYEPTSGVTYGLHLTRPTQEEKDELDAMLQSVNEEFVGCQTLRVWISGCCKTPGLPDYDYKQIRSGVEIAVRQGLPNANLDFKWPPPDSRMASLTLDVELGECYLDSSSREGLS